MPVTVTPINATNFKNMSISFKRVPSRVETQFKKVTRNKPTRATDLLIHGLIVSASGPITARTRYSPIMMAMIAAPPGLRTNTATQVKRKPHISPNILERYTCGPPLRGMAPPSSA